MRCNSVSNEKVTAHAGFTFNIVRKPDKNIPGKCAMIEAITSIFAPQNCPLLWTMPKCQISFRQIDKTDFWIAPLFCFRPNYSS
jgi:hypothetical protein